MNNTKKVRGFETVKDEFRKNDLGIKIQTPTRGSKTSAGYDLYSPIKIVVPANNTALIWSDVKAYMKPNEVLILHIRSSIGIKRGLVLSNVTGVIDQDYFENPKNDGNIGIALRNLTNKDVIIEAGERVCQGIFMPFLEADNGNTDTERSGGIGSSGTK